MGFLLYISVCLVFLYLGYKDYNYFSRKFKDGEAIHGYEELKNKNASLMSLSMLVGSIIFIIIGIIIYFYKLFG